MRPGDDLATLARDVMADGADVLGMAGGDGSLALVASLAAAHELAFVCVPAGTRNHLARDLGVDRDDPVGALDAFLHGVQQRMDLAEVNGRTFVNNVSLGLYALAVQRPDYRRSKLRALLDTLPEVMGPSAPSPPVQLTDDLGSRRTDAAVVLISNNPYATDHLLARGTRRRMDTGELGIVVVDRHGGDDARAWSAREFEVAATRAISAGVDGEAVTLEPPFRFRSRPGALLVRISPHHPGISPSALLPRRARDVVPRLARIALGRPIVHVAPRNGYASE
jgi:diacylglycerol kinase family enzyme